MKKRISCIILTVLFLFAGAMAINEMKAEAHDKTEEEDMFEIQAEACSANEELYNSFEFYNAYVYPKSFGGTFIDYDTLHVLVSDESEMDYYKNILAGYKCVKYDVVEHSYNELYEEIEEIVKELPNEIDIVSYGVNAVKNKAFICVTEESFSLAKSHIKNSDILVESSERIIR